MCLPAGIRHLDSLFVGLRGGSTAVLALENFMVAPPKFDD